MAQYTRSILRTNSIRVPLYSWYRLRMRVLMLLADLAGLALATVFGHLIAGDSFKFDLFTPSEVHHILVIGIILLLFTTSRLYPGVGIDPAEEIKLVTQYSSSALIVGIVLKIVLDPSWLSGAITMLCVWALSIISILVMRWSVRIAATQAGLWGEPVAVLARGTQVGDLTRYFLQRYRLGFVPVLAATDGSAQKPIEGQVPVVSLSSLTSGGSARFVRDVETLLVDASFFGQNLTDDSYKHLSSMFRHIIFISDMGWFEGASLAVRDFEGLIGIEARRNLIDPLSSAMKRIIDMIGSILAGVLFSPFLLLIAALIKLDSAGPAFYSQLRVGRDRKTIRVYKFRTMVRNADQVLDDYLERNAELRREWDETQKLREDPRITRVGRFLRKFSLDEIPQLFNVLLGDMSLVGPRPIMVNQVGLYGKGINTYRDVRPGLTGLWQVSGRNRTTFKERTRFDLYYVRHWSVWLDLYILLRTVWVVLSRDGAY